MKIKAENKNSRQPQPDMTPLVSYVRSSCKGLPALALDISYETLTHILTEKFDMNALRHLAEKPEDFTGYTWLIDRLAQVVKQNDFVKRHEIIALFLKCVNDASHNKNLAKRRFNTPLCGFLSLSDKICSILDDYPLLLEYLDNCYRHSLSLARSRYGDINLVVDPYLCMTDELTTQWRIHLKRGIPIWSRLNVEKTEKVLTMIRAGHYNSLDPYHRADNSLFLSPLKPIDLTKPTGKAKTRGAVSARALRPPPH